MYVEEYFSGITYLRNMHLINFAFNKIELRKSASV